MDQFRRAIDGGERVQPSARQTLPTPPAEPGRPARGRKLVLGVSAGLLALSLALVARAVWPLRLQPLPVVRAPPPAPPVVVHPLSLSRVLIDPTPADAVITVDGARRLERPVAIEGRPGQAFELRLERDGYEPLSRQIIMEDGERRSPIALLPIARRPAHAKRTKHARTAAPTSPPAPASLDRNITADPFEAP
jgi:hypothetical protein